MPWVEVIRVRVRVKVRVRVRVRPDRLFFELPLKFESESFKDKRQNRMDKTSVENGLGFYPLTFNLYPLSNNFKRSFCNQRIIGPV